PAAPRRSIETVSIWALFVTCIVAVFFFIPSTTTPLMVTKTFLLAAGALITLALYILARLSRGNVIFPPLVLVGALWLPVVAYALSSVFSGIPFTQALWGSGLGTDTLGFILAVTVLGALTALILRRSEQYRSFLIAGAFVFCAVAVLETLTVLFAYRTLIVSGVLALFLLAIANVSLVWILLALVSLGLFVESVMNRGPRTADADLDDVDIIDDAPVAMGTGKHSLVLPLCVLAISLFFLVGGTLGGALAQTLNVNVLDVRPSWQSTYSVARNTFTTSPIFGSGPGTFGVEWLKYRDASLNSTVFWNIDFTSGIGSIPTSVVTTGLLGVIAWVTFFALLIVFGLRMLMVRASRDTFIRYVAIFSFVASLYLFTIAIFNVPNAVILALAFVFMGLFVSTTRYAEGGRQWGIVFSRSPRVGFVIVFMLTIVLLASVVAAYALVGRYIATAKIASATAAFSAGDLDTADKAAQDSISFAPSVVAYQIQASVAGARLGQILTSTTMSATAAQKAFQEALSSGINAALTATLLAPSNYQSWLVLGNLYAQAVPLGVAGAYDSAKSAYEKAQTLNPTSPQIPFILAQLDIANKNIKGAKEHLKVAIGLKQDYTAAIFLLSQLEVQDGNVREALAAALAAAYFTPNNPSILFQVGILYAAQNDFANAARALEAAVEVNPQFANARYFLSAVYAKQGDLEKALAQMQAIAAMSEENAQAVTAQLAALEAKKNPFPTNLLTITPAP
ncbi:MAG: Tetratricopeptide TPR_4 containing protein, partial [Parcubacteria group bacterium GW2011_GWA1_54_9]